MKINNLFNPTYIYSLLILSCILCFQISCKNANDQSNTIEEKIENNLKYSLTPFSNSTEYPEAILSLTSYINGIFDFNVDSDTYELGQQTPDAPQKMCANSDKGQHIHLIVDTDPYIAKYESSFEQSVSDGEHYMLAFISRSYHESIKTGTSYIVQKVDVSDNSITSSEEVSDEMLFYSRPKGTYVGKANTEKVMLDFFLVNTELSANRKVKAMINGEEHIIDKWQPYYIEGLPMGQNTITLTLIDGNGNNINVPNNPVSREFELKADPAEDI
jgi:hypothetical protein